jgi:hypothetical protein
MRFAFALGFFLAAASYVQAQGQCSTTVIQTTMASFKQPGLVCNLNSSNSSNYSPQEFRNLCSNCLQLVTKSWPQDKCTVSQEEIKRAFEADSAFGFCKAPLESQPPGPMRLCADGDFVASFKDMPEYPACSSLKEPNKLSALTLQGMRWDRSTPKATFW